MAIFLIMVGFAVNTVFGIVIIVRAFKVSVGWGLAVIFLPFAALLFVINNWQDTKVPFLAGLGGWGLILLGVLAAPKPDPGDAEVTRRIAARANDRASDEDDEDAPAANYASAAAPVPYTPPRSTYQPSSYTPPPYNPPPPAPAPAPAVTDTQPAEDEWTRGKPVLEQVYIDRATNQFYAAKCKKRPENTYRLPKSVAVMQGYTEAACK